VNVAKIVYEMIAFAADNVILPMNDSVSGLVGDLASRSKWRAVLFEISPPQTVYATIR
jgi:hypothetical protein